MPTYRYECTKCGRTFDFFQSIKEAPKKKCPECGGKLERLIGGGAGVILKGSGFHNTDYRSKSYQSGAKSEKSDSGTSSPDKGGAAKSEPKKKEGGGSESK